MYPTLASFNKMKILLFLLCLTFVYGDTCTPDSNGCAQCDEDNCIECTTTGHYIKANGCVAQCDGGFYAYTETRNECKPCADKCAECGSGPDSQKCVVCKDTLFPNDEGDKCEDDCPSEKLKYKITAQGDDKNEIWGKCVTKEQCTESNRYSKGTEECIEEADCEDFIVESNKECKECGTDCIECDEVDLCTDCATDKYINKDKTACTNDCGDGFYKSEGTIKTCEPCGGDCKCVQPDICTGCITSDKYVKDNTECVTEEDCIDDSHFVSGEECEPCDESCQTCEGPNDDECLTCKSSAPWLEEGKCVGNCLATKYKHDTDEGKKCLDNCPDTYYKDDDDMSCEKCGPHCKVCTDVDSCTECIKDSGHEYL